MAAYAAQRYRSIASQDVKKKPVASPSDTPLKGQRDQTHRYDKIKTVTFINTFVIGMYNYRTFSIL